MVSMPRRVLDAHDLELVIALAESGSTVRASATLHLTQSAISRGLLAVEDKLGTKLFDRQPRGLALTAAGRRLLSGAGSVLAQLVELEHQVRTGTSGIAPLRVVCECYTAYRWLPATLTALAPAMRGLEITVAIDHTHAPVKALHERTVDVALLTTARIAAPLVDEPLFSDEIVFVLAASHPLAAHAALTAGDLRQTTLISSTSAPDAERLWFAKRVFGKLRPRNAGLRFPLTEAIIDATRAGMGVAVLSEWVAAPYVAANNDLVVRALKGKRLLRPWRIAYRPDAANAARQLAVALRGAPPRLLLR
jgi:LysR family transcriptional regulator for metE and metH